MSQLNVGYCGFHGPHGEDGFCTEKYLEAQRARILSRVKESDRLYLEFGGKIMFDFHAARVLPGYDPNVKIRLLKSLASTCDVICCVGAKQIESRKRRADFGITYDADVLKIIGDFQRHSIAITAVVITQFSGQPAATRFRDLLEAKGLRVFTHPYIAGYPDDVDTVVSEAGYGKCQFIPVTKPLVVVTAPGPGAGKLATCLSQLYHEFKNGHSVRYSKFESFPIWDLPLEHPINWAYEAATLDLDDRNLIDPHHLKAYGKSCVNYCRDIDAFPLLSNLFQKITGAPCAYRSPTDMGVNMIAQGIINDEVCQEAAKQEVIRRYFIAKAELADGTSSQAMVERGRLLMETVGVTETSRPVVEPARLAGAAIQLRTGEIITAPTPAEAVVKACAFLGKCQGEVLSTASLQAIGELKAGGVTPEPPIVSVQEALIALAAVETPNAKVAQFHVAELYGCQMHFANALQPGDVAGLRKIGVQITCDAVFTQF